MFFSMTGASHDRLCRPDRAPGSRMTRRISGAQVLTRGEAAQVLGVHPSTVTRWAAAGLLPCVRTPSGERRYRSRDVEELVNQRLNVMPAPG
jgi:excisionase family DNA binding protein